MIGDRGSSWCRVAPKWQRSGTHLVQNHTEREQVGASIEFLASNLLRRHIGDGSQRTAGTREMFLRLDGRGAHGNALWLERDLGQPEIENLRLTAIRDEDVRGLDVPVNDALRVCGVEIPQQTTIINTVSRMGLLLFMSVLHELRLL